MVGAQLRETAQELAVLLWREHTVYRERSGGMVIRGEHVRRWISLAPAGGRDEILVRAGRILDGGTTAPARSEAVVPLSAGTGVLAAACRRLLADAAADAARPAPDRAASGRTSKRTAPWVPFSKSPIEVVVTVSSSGSRSTVSRISSSSTSSPRAINRT
ncbi:hypothetical protein [Streptomyces griseus]|uniref:hypothetical protein n=1 Tax=Streptomyces griseus TaxID=1911 RepID=UPI0036D18AC7